MCAYLDNFVYGQKVDVYSSVCSNNVIIDNALFGNSDSVECGKSDVQNNVFNKSICNDDFNKMNNNMHVSVENSSIHFLDMSSKAQVASEHCGGNWNVFTSPTFEGWAIPCLRHLNMSFNLDYLAFIS